MLAIGHNPTSPPGYPLDSTWYDLRGLCLIWDCSVGKPDCGRTLVLGQSLKENLSPGRFELLGPGRMQSPGCCYMFERVHPDFRTIWFSARCFKRSDKCRRFGIEVPARGRSAPQKRYLREELKFAGAIIHEMLDNLYNTALERFPCTPAYRSFSSMLVSRDDSHWLLHRHRLHFAMEPSCKGFEHRYVAAVLACSVLLSKQVLISSGIGQCSLCGLALNMRKGAMG